MVRLIVQALPAESENALVRLAASVAANNEERVEQLKQALKDKAHQTMATAISQVRDLDCDCRERIAERIKAGFQFDLGLLRAANDKLTEFIQVKYTETTVELKRDIRIFTATNAIAFVGLVLLSLFRPRAMVHLFLPGIMLAIAVVFCSWFYVMEQDWLLTIIYGNYVGMAYAGYLVVVYAFLCDIAFNSGSITTAILNAVAEAIGSAVTFSPC